jgi:hypothetical protein
VKPHVDNAQNHSRCGSKNITEQRDPGSQIFTSIAAFHLNRLSEDVTGVLLQLLLCLIEVRCLPLLLLLLLLLPL